MPAPNPGPPPPRPTDDSPWEVKDAWRRWNAAKEKYLEDQLSSGRDITDVINPATGQRYQNVKEGGMSDVQRYGSRNLGIAGSFFSGAPDPNWEYDWASGKKRNIATSDIPGRQTWWDIEPWEHSFRANMQSGGGRGASSYADILAMNRMNQDVRFGHRVPAGNGLFYDKGRGYFDQFGRLVKPDDGRGPEGGGGGFGGGRGGYGGGFSLFGGSMSPLEEAMFAQSLLDLEQQATRFGEREREKKGDFVSPDARWQADLDRSILGYKTEIDPKTGEAKYTPNAGGGFDPMRASSWGLLAPMVEQQMEGLDNARTQLEQFAPRGGARDLAEAQLATERFTTPARFRQAQAGQAMDRRANVEQAVKFQQPYFSGAGGQLLGAATSKYGTDVGAETTRRGQDIQRDLGFGDLDLRRTLGMGDLSLRGRDLDLRRDLGFGDLNLRGELGRGGLALDRDRFNFQSGPQFDWQRQQDQWSRQFQQDQLRQQQRQGNRSFFGSMFGGLGSVLGGLGSLGLFGGGGGAAAGGGLALF